MIPFTHNTFLHTISLVLAIPLSDFSKYATLPLLAQQCGIPTAMRAPCLLRRLVASQLLALRALVASQLVRFTDSVLRTSWESY